MATRTPKQRRFLAERAAEAALKELQDIGLNLTTEDEELFRWQIPAQIDLFLRVLGK